MWCCCFFTSLLTFIFLNDFLTTNAEKPVTCMVIMNDCYAFYYDRLEPTNTSVQRPSHTDSYRCPFPCSVRVGLFSPAVSLDTTDSENTVRRAETQGRSSFAGTHSTWFIFFAVLDLLIKQLWESDREREMKREKRDWIWAKDGSTVKWV